MNLRIFLFLLFFTGVGSLSGEGLKSDEVGEISYSLELSSGEFVFIGTAGLDSRGKFLNFRRIASGYLSVQGSVKPQMRVSINCEVSPLGVTRLVHDIKVENGYLLDALSDHLDGGGFMSWPSDYKVDFDRRPSVSPEKSFVDFGLVRDLKILGCVNVISPGREVERRFFLIYVGAGKPKQFSDIKDQKFEYRARLIK
jgi:hypothetical protein